MAASSSVASRAPQSIEEYMVAALEKSTGCTTEGVIPPPQTCPKSVQSMYGFAQSHILTILVAVVFLVVLVQMAMMAINPNAGGH